MLTIAFVLFLSWKRNYRALKQLHPFFLPCYNQAVHCPFVWGFLIYISLGWAWDKKSFFWPPLPLLTLDMGHCSADCAVQLLLCFHVCQQIEGSIGEGTVLLHNHIKFNDGGVIFDNLPPSTSFWSHTAWKAGPHFETWIYRQVLEDYGPIWVVLWSCQGPVINQKIRWTASPSKSTSYMSWCLSCSVWACSRHLGSVILRYCVSNGFGQLL